MHAFAFARHAFPPIPPALALGLPCTSPLALPSSFSASISSPDTEVEEDVRPSTNARNLSRPNIGASDSTVKNTSLNRISGDSKIVCIVCADAACVYTAPDAPRTPAAAPPDVSVECRAAVDDASRGADGAVELMEERSAAEAAAAAAATAADAEEAEEARSAGEREEGEGAREEEKEEEEREVEEASVWRMSPIWQVTAVQGRLPMKAPRAESRMGTAVTPHAMFMPDQGTMPMRRRTERRTHAADFCFWCFEAVGVVGGAADGDEGVGGEREREKEGVVRGG